MDLYFSLDVPARIGAFAGSHRAIWIYNRQLGSVTQALECAFMPERADLVALDQAVDLDGDGLTDYEEQTGVDEASSTHPATHEALGPNGRTSLMDDADSDDDGWTDGQEAEADTDPLDPESHPPPVPAPTGTVIKLCRAAPRERGAVSLAASGAWYALNELRPVLARPNAPPPRISPGRGAARAQAPPGA